MSIPPRIHHVLPGEQIHPAIADLVEAYPLAWVTSQGAQTVLSTPLPIIGEFGSQGNLESLIGHFSLLNSHVAGLQNDARATILFAGPQGYISPMHVADLGWAPTWNYSVARFHCRIHFEPESNDAALRRLTGKMEGMCGGSWTVDNVGSRYDAMKARIIAFRAEILECDASFKLGQDENDGDFASIVAGIDNQPLATWMNRARAEDLQSQAQGTQTV